MTDTQSATEMNDTGSDTKLSKAVASGVGDHRARIYKGLSLGLGFFSLALGALEVLAPKQIAKALDAKGHETLIRSFGARELVAGAGLIQDPGHGVRMWNRVVGDVMDLSALHMARTNSPNNRNIWAAIAVVAAVTTLDAITAVGLDRQTGKSLPIGR
jgi:hypothetical protein